MTIWDGKERRINGDKIERDRLLERIDANLTNLIDNFEDHRTDYEDHVRKDDSRFGAIQRVMWMAVGGLAVLEVILKLSK